MKRVLRNLYRNDLTILKRLLDNRNNHSSDWKEFLRRFSNLILKVIWQFENGKDQVMDKYLAVCTKLVENNFSILRKYNKNNTDKTPKFTTWFVVVVKNLCIDEHRKSNPRKRYPKALLRLPEIDKKIFELYFWKGLSEEEILNTLSKNDNEVFVGESIERIEESLNRSRDYIYCKNSTVKTVTYNDKLLVTENERQYNNEELNELLENWLAQLSEIERLIIRLRFWEDLSVKDISNIIKIYSEQKIYSIIRNVMLTLRKNKIEL